MKNALEVVREAAEARPDDPLAGLVLALTTDVAKFPFPELFIQESLANCAREIEATK